jgi:hypothetical protein
MEQATTDGLYSQNQRILNFIRKHQGDKGVSVRDIHLNTKLDYANIKLILANLLAVDEIRYEGKIVGEQDRRRFFTPTE